jgi:hypothetical protein
MKNKREILLELASGAILIFDRRKLVRMEENGCIQSKFSDRVSNWREDYFRFVTPEYWSIYEPPKEKKKYYQWKLKRIFGYWHRTNSYLNDEGKNTNGYLLYDDWSTIEKIRIDDDFVEV